MCNWKVWAADVFVLQSGHHPSVEEEGGQRKLSSEKCCGPIQLAGRLEGL